MNKFDPTKPVQTRDGRKARIICSNAKQGRYPIVALVENRDMAEEIGSFTTDGKEWDFESKGKRDLINVPERIEREYWVNVYEDRQGIGFWDSKQLADDYAGDNRLACVKMKISCNVGEGLEAQ